MKVIEGGFGKGELPDHAGERLRVQLEDSGVLEIKNAVFTLLFDSGDSMFIMSNGDGPGEVLLNMEKGKMAVMSNVYAGGVNPNDNSKQPS
jgi:hypothetical protein